jgi:transposase
MSRPSPYPAELRQRAMRMVAEVRPNYESDWAAITAVAQKLGIGTAETLRKWVRQAQVDTGQRAGVSTDESAELKRLRRENAELRRANEILKSASRSPRSGCSSRTDQTARTVEDLRPGRDRHPGIRRLVQPPPPAKRRRGPATSRLRNPAPPHRTPPHRGDAPTRLAATNPGRFSARGAGFSAPNHLADSVGSPSSTCRPCPWRKGSSNVTTWTGYTFQARPRGASLRLPTTSCNLDGCLEDKVIHDRSRLECDAVSPRTGIDTGSVPEECERRV